MLEHFRAHTIVHLKFLARSRVLIGFALLVAVASAIGIVPALFFESASNRFEVLKDIARVLHYAAGILTGMLGLVMLWSHRRMRAVKMVAAKPSPFEGWVASIFAAGALVALAVHGAVVAVMFVLSLAWGVPYQIGFVFVAANALVRSLVILGVLTALGAAMHPVLALVVVVFFNEWTFENLGTLVSGVLRSGEHSLILRAARKILAALYYAAPTLSPFSDKFSLVYQTLRVEAVDWRYLAASAAYALLVCACGFLATLAVLRRRPLI